MGNHPGTKVIRHYAAGTPGISKIQRLQREAKKGGSLFGAIKKRRKKRRKKRKSKRRMRRKQKRR